MQLSKITVLALCLNSSYFGFYAHAGFLDGLVAQGIRPKAISGSSAGALAAGLFASGIPAPDIVTLLTRVDLNQILQEWSVPVRATKLMLNWPGITGALRPGRALSLLRKYVGDRKIEDCVNPRLAIGVTNLTTARAENVTAGPLADFMVASCAYPGLFAAHTIDGQHYWDGGIAIPAPVEPWIRDPEIHTILIHQVLNCGEIRAHESGKTPTIFNAVGVSHQIIGDEILRIQIELARHCGKRVTVLRTVTPRAGLWRQKLGPKLVELGRATAFELNDSLDVSPSND